MPCTSSRRPFARVAVSFVMLVTGALVVALAIVPAGRASATTKASTKTSAKASTKKSTKAAAEAIANRVVAGTLPSAPYAVGVTHATYVDTTRGRTIAVTIRYPVMGDAGDDEVVDGIADVGDYPLVVFAHGYDVSAATYATLEHQVAAAGFVVAAPDFPHTSSAVTDTPDEDDVANQAADVSFVISQLLDGSTAPAVLAGAIADTKVGVVGHSDGGVTAAAVAYNSTVADPRVGAAVVLSGAEARYGGSWFTTQSPPLLAVHGTADEVNPLGSSEQLFADARGPKMLVTVSGGSHLGPFTTDAEEPTIATLVGDFLRAHLSGDTAAAGRLGSDADVPGVLSLAAAG